MSILSGKLSQQRSHHQLCRKARNALHASKGARKTMQPQVASEGHILAGVPIVDSPRQFAALAASRTLVEDLPLLGSAIADSLRQLATLVASRTLVKALWLSSVQRAGDQRQPGRLYSAGLPCIATGVRSDWTKARHAKEGYPPRCLLRPRSCSGCRTCLSGTPLWKWRTCQHRLLY